MNRKTALSGLSFIVIAIVIMSPTYVMAQNTLTFSLTRNFGTALGSSITGTFTLHATAPDDVVGLIVYFNGVEVHSVSSNTISWQFVTDDYPPGETNITLYGWDDDGGTYVGSQQYNFLSPTISTAFTVGIIILVAILAFAKYGPKLMGRGKKESDN